MKPGSGNGSYIDLLLFLRETGVRLYTSVRYLCPGSFRKKRFFFGHGTFLFQLLFIALFCIACGKGKTQVVGEVFNPETSPVIHTEDVSTLISDSGITRYRIQTKIWDVYSKAKDPYWYFPQGIYVERYDTLFNVESSVEADTAYFFVNRKLWRAVGNVRVMNLDGTIFDTSELFWDQTKALVYSDKFVRVQMKDKEITGGIGLRSNEAMSEYSFYHAGVDIYEPDKEPGTGDEMKTDSISPGN